MYDLICFKEHIFLCSGINNGGAEINIKTMYVTNSTQISLLSTDEGGKYMTAKVTSIQVILLLELSFDRV
ncbi:hypothetical protein C0J52_09130 [Blattella germanica]|nr:hypothetical protein C0J52_09130 [Blattella germanica]